MFIEIINYETNKTMSLNIFNLIECYSRDNNVNPDDQVHPYLVVYKTSVGVLYYEGYADETSAENRVNAIMSMGHVPNYQTKTVNPTTQAQTVEPDDDYDALATVNVNAVTSSIDANITAENIKKDVSILGVTGTLEAGNPYTYFAESSLGSGIASYIKTIPLITVYNLTDFFKGCRSLTTIPQLDTSSVTNMAGAFHECSSLTTIPQLDTSSVTNMRGMFNDCSSLTTIPQLDTSKVIDMANMFNACEILTTIPQLDTSSATNMYQTFNACRLITTFPASDTSKVTDMYCMCTGCRVLTEIPQLDLSNVTNMEAAFYGCTALTTIPLSNAPKITNMNYTFGNCPNLTDTSLDNILQICVSAVKISTKTLASIGLTSTNYPASRIQALPHYQNFIDAGWTIGY